MRISYSFKFGCILIPLIILFSAGCGKYANLSWTEVLERGKKIRADTSIPAQERFIRAEEIYLIALDKLEKALGREPVRTNDMRELFGEIETIFRTQNKHVELEPILKKKINIYTKYLGQNKMLTGAAHENLGHLYKKLGSKQAATDEYREAMKVYQNNKRDKAVEKMRKLISAL